MSNAQPGKQRIDGADLDARSATGVPEFSGGDVVIAIRLQQWQRSESLDELCAGLGPREPLEQFLQNQPRRDDHVGPHEHIFEDLNLRFRCLGVATQRE